MITDGGFDDFAVTSTPFRASVSGSEPFRFGQFAAQDVCTSVRLTHLVYTPPSAEEWLEYKASAGKNGDAGLPDTRCVLSVAAKVRAMLLNGSVSSFVIACFPLDTDRIDGAHSADAMVPAPGTAAATVSSSLAASAACAPPKVESTLSLDGGYHLVVPLPTDIAANLDVRLDVDGSVELQVDGPGHVVFVGEQYSALIPEWMNHRMFRVGAGDEELPETDDEEGSDDDDMSNGEWEEMYRLAR